MTNETPTLWALCTPRLTLRTSKTQRALWTFLFFTLVGPFMAAIAVFFASAMLAEAGRLPAATFKGGPLPSTTLAAGFAMQAFVLGTFASAIAGAGLAALTTLRGGFGWLEAAIAGVLGFMAVVIGSGAVAPSYLTPLAFLAACIALACRALVIRVGMLPGD